MNLLTQTLTRPLALPNLTGIVTKAIKWIGAAYRALTAAPPVVVAAAAATVFVATVAVKFWPTITTGAQYDDSYITYRYAINLATGNGYVFNTYERVNSASSLLYTLLLAAAYKIGLHDLERVSMAIGVACGALTVGMVSLMARRISGNVAVSILIALPLAICGALSGWSVSGMETVLYCALVTGLAYALILNCVPVALALMVACLLTRPEAVLIPAVLVPVLLINHQWRTAGLFALVAAVTVVGWLAFNYLYYGTAMPHPVAMKEVATYYKLPRHIQFELIKGFFTRFSWIGVLATIGAAAALKHKQGVAAQWLIGFLLLSGASFVFGPRADMERYCVHAVPLLAILAAFAWQWRLSVPVKAVGLVMASLLAIGQAKADAGLTAQFFANMVETQLARREIGKLINTTVPDSELILSSDIGALSYEAPRHQFIDMIGLTTAAPVCAVVAKDWSRCIEWVKSKRPSYVADTHRPEGYIQALGIYQRPHEFFNTSQRTVEPPGAQLVKEIKAGKHSIILARLDWKD